MATLVAQTITNTINPTEGFVSYVKDVKPYHTKILEVLTEYVYTEEIAVTLTERDTWTIALTRPDTEIITTCGYGTIWDSLAVLDFPVVSIVEAVGELNLPVFPLVNPDPTILIIANDPNTYSLQVNDPVTFVLSGATNDNAVLSTTTGDIIPGQPYYILSNTGTEITLSETIGGTAISFTLSEFTDIALHPEGLPYNSFLVTDTAPAQYQCIASNLLSNQFTFAKVYNIVAVNIPSKQWVVSGVVDLLVVGNYIHVRNNTGSGANKQYTIASSSYSIIDDETTITVVEAISSLAQPNGVLNVQDDMAVVPNWVYGMSVKVSSGGTLPFPLNSSATYYFIPTTVNSIFNLSTKPYPAHYSDLVNISTYGDGLFTIERGEVFYPGAIVNVNSSYNGLNDGTYHINQIVQEGANLRIYPQEKVIRYTPPYLTMDGVMVLDDTMGYDKPRLCVPLQTPDLYTGAYVSEHIAFEFNLSLTDAISSIMFENNAGNPIAVEELTYMSVSPQGGNILPTGYDLQFFDVGGMDEDLMSVTHYIQ